ncbi:hypothetical protein BGX34_004423, partial [Mortierella sp. NVP85]
MVFGGVISSPRGNLSLQQALEIANIYLEHAEKAQDPDIAMVFCYDAEASLHQARKVAKRAESQTIQNGVANGYIRLGRALSIHGHLSEAKAIYKKAEKFGVNVQDHGQDHGQLAQHFAPSMKSTVTSIADIPQDISQQMVPPQKKNRKSNNAATLPNHIFAENVRPPTTMGKLPEPDERLISTSQLAYCLAILKHSHALDDILEPSTRKWIHIIENDQDEHERLKVLALDVIRTFKKEEIKDAKAVAEV